MLVHYLTMPALLLGVTALGSGLRAETLREAMVAAMRHYPPVLAEAARRDAARAGIGAARAGWYPRVTASGDIGAASGDRGLAAGTGSAALGTIGSPFGTDWTARWGYSVMAEQSLYDGHRTRSGVAEAEAGASAATEQVRVVEQLVLLDTATAYADLVRDQDVERLREGNAAALARQVATLLERSQKGDATLTDLAQARARHAQALAELISARASVAARKAEYARIVGHAPRKLSSPPLPALPSSAEAAIQSAFASHPVAIAAGFREDASRHAIDRYRADGLPQVKLRGGVEGDRSLSGVTGRDAASVSVRVNVPIFDGGETAARVEQARHINRSLAEESRGVRDRLHAGAVTAWTGFLAARERTGVEKQSLAENERAVAGLEDEVRLGQRTVVDLLDAQRELINAQVRVAASERDVVVAAYALLSAAGTLTLPMALEQGPRKARAANWSAPTVVRHAR